MKRFISLIAVVSLCACASIVSKSQWPVNISSSPSEAKFTITGKNGMVIHSGQTPAALTLEAGDGYFSKAQYTLKYEKAGYETKTYQLTPTINGWYFGNILLLTGGVVIGMLIVDPLSGAMYKLPEVVNVSLDADKHSNNSELKVLSLNDLTAEQKAKLVRLN